MAIGNGELVHECFLKHSRMGTARMKLDKETDEDCKKRGVSMARSPDGLSQHNQNTIVIKIILNNFIRYGKSQIKFN